MPNSKPERPVLQLSDTDAATPVRHDGDAVASSAVGDGRVLQIRGALTIQGDLGASQVNVGAAAVVRGVIRGGQSGRYAVSGSLQCRAIIGGSVTTQSTVRVEEGVEAARLTCGGHLDVGGGIVGSDVAANGGITCRTLGSADGLTTVVEAGEGRTMLLLTQAADAKIRTDRSQAAEARIALGPMLENIRSLSPQERERVTEMLADADDAEGKITKLVAAFERRKRLVAQQADARIVVQETAHAGVRIRMGSIEATLKTAIAGPVTFLARTSDGRREVIAVDDATQAVTVLPSDAISLAAAA